MFKRYKPFFKAGAMDLLAYKFNILTWLVVSVFEVVCIVFLWIAVYQNSSDGVNSIINGFNFKEMIAYLVFINMFTFVTFDGTTLWTINEEIKKGTITMAFTRPISYRKRFIATTLGALSVMNLMLGLPCFIIAYIVFILIEFIAVESIWIFAAHIILFFIAQLLAALINDVLNYIFGVLCFYTSSGWGINQIKQVIVMFLSGTLVPIAFFPDAIKTIVGYLPFAGMAQNPVLILLMKVDIVNSLILIGISLFWWIVLEVFGMILFNKASKKVTVQGG